MGITRHNEVFRPKLDVINHFSTELQGVRQMVVPCEDETGCHRRFVLEVHLSEWHFYIDTCAATGITFNREMATEQQDTLAHTDQPLLIARTLGLGGGKLHSHPIIADAQI